MRKKKEKNSPLYELARKCNDFINSWLPVTLPGRAPGVCALSPGSVSVPMKHMRPVLWHRSQSTYTAHKLLIPKEKGEILE